MRLSFAMGQMWSMFCSFIYRNDLIKHEKKILLGLVIMKVSIVYFIKSKWLAVIFWAAI